MKVAVTRIPSPASLASHVHTMVSMLENCRLNGHEGWVDWDNEPAVLYRKLSAVNQWLHYFEGKSSIMTEQYWTYDRHAWRRHCPIVGDLPWNAETPEQFDHLRDVVPRHLKVNGAVRDHAQELAINNDLALGRTICVAHRGTDKGIECPISPIEDYFETVAGLMVSNPGFDVWIQAEEEETYSKFFHRFPKAKRVKEFFATPRAGTMADFVNPRSGYQKGLDAMAMMHMMSKCPFFLRNASNLHDLAVGLGTGTVYHFRGEAAYVKRHPAHTLTNRADFVFEWSE